MKGKGWHKEPRRHSLASRGIKTAVKDNPESRVKVMKSPNKFINKINTKTRIYWEHKDSNMLANVEKIGGYWVFTKGEIKGKQESVTLNTKEESISRAKDYMRFHSYNPNSPIISGDDRANYMFEGDLF